MFRDVLTAKRDIPRHRRHRSCYRHPSLSAADEKKTACGKDCHQEFWLWQHDSGGLVLNSNKGKREEKARYVGKTGAVKSIVCNQQIRHLYSADRSPLTAPTNTWQQQQQPSDLMTSAPGQRHHPLNLLSEIPGQRKSSGQPCVQNNMESVSHRSRPVENMQWSVTQAALYAPSLHAPLFLFPLLLSRWYNRKSR